MNFYTNVPKMISKSSIFAFPGNSLSAILDGKARLLFLNRDEEYVITMPYAHCKGKQRLLLSVSVWFVHPVMDL